MTHANGSQGAPELVSVVIDGKTVKVPKGTNLVEAAKIAGVEIPFYCYHPHLSVAGNCRMCQVQIKGMRKMEIACNTVVKEGMEVQTHFTSPEVAKTQAATLELILINHPLDCTVCDQAGHCKLQDYHYEYNAKASRFIEEKEHKVKAVPLGPTVMLDGERCIMCTRCIRFCDEVTGTSELGMLNRGDRAVIAVAPGKELNNPLSGTVVDLCPVGALTHRNWRFNTRIWFTKQTDTICPGCSTGCNAKVAERDGKVVQVKGRLNDQVNKEWLCDEGRYGFQRFLPESRQTKALLNGKAALADEALTETKRLSQVQGESVVFLSPDLLLEEYALVKNLVEKGLRGATVVVAYRGRALTEVEKVLVSPDYAANFRGAEFSGVVSGDLEAQYQAALERVRSGTVAKVLVVGDRAVLKQDIDLRFADGLRKATISVGILTDADAPLVELLKVVLPGRSILEKSGLLINRAGRLQYTDRVVDFPEGSEPDWRVLAKISERCGVRAPGGLTDRESTLGYLASEPRLAGLTIALVKAGGIDLSSYKPGGAAAKSTAEAHASAS